VGTAGGGVKKRREAIWDPLRLTGALAILPNDPDDQGRCMKTLKTMVAGVAVLLTLAALPPKHIELVSSFPAADTVLTKAPSELVLTFNADLDFGRSAATMRSPQGTPVKLGDPQTTDDPRQMVVAVTEDLEAGTYMVSWTAAPKDYHGGRGRFRFEVR